MSRVSFLSGLGLCLLVGFLLASPVTAAEKSACCLPDGRCKDVSEKSCDKRGGTFYPGETCENVQCEPADPCETATLKAKCKRKAEINKAHVKMKKGPQSEEVTFRFDGDPETDIIVMTTKSGKAKIKVKGLDDGDHVVEVIFDPPCVPENIKTDFVCR